MSSPSLPSKSEIRLRLIARIISGAIVGIALLTFVGHVLFPEPTVANYPWVENLLPLVMGLSVIGLALAFRWERLGALLSLGFFVLHLVMYWIIRGHFFPLWVLWMFLPLPLAALLFLYLGIQRMRREK